ncbi:MAG: MFS transporter [Candidatus Hodarchaeales archaeon]|jgi:DHA3 family macrolide efflux protein-like MFS transporter
MESNTVPEPVNHLKSYILFLTGQWVSILGSNIVRFGIIWYLTVKTGSPFILALAAFFAFAPFIIVTPISGVFVDRWDRKKIIIFVDFIQALLTVVLIGVFAGISIPELNLNLLFSDDDLIKIIFGMSIISGIFGAFHTAAVDTLLPIMVPQNHLSRVNGLNFLVNGGIQIIGPLIGAFALSFMLLRDLFWLDVITFLLAIIPTLLISIPRVKREKKEVGKGSSFQSEFNEGISFISATNGLLALLAVFTGANFFLSPIFSQIPILVSEIHLGNEDSLAFVFAMQQVGMLLGSLLMSSWKGFENNAKGVAIGLFVGYIGMYVMVLAPLGNFYVLGGGLLITGFVLPLANVSSETIWAKIVPKDILGRVYSVRRTIAQISAPVGILLGGFLAELFGLVFILGISTLAGTILLLYAWFFTAFSQVERLSAESRKDKMNEKEPPI